MIELRPATMNDMELLLQFEQGIILAERPYDETLKPDPNHYYDLPDMIASPHIEFLVAIVDGQVVGCGYARIEKAKHYLAHEQHAYLGFMFVLPAFRGRGINQHIMLALKNWAKAQQITELKLDVYAENHSAIKAYEKVGFKPYMMAMRMPVD
jgi:RimJ/RimL family protein N-acetyltransferase